MKKLTIKTYKFDELSKEGQEKVIESVRNSESYLDWEWWDSSYEWWTEKLECLGYSNVKIYFSGFWSQGDGACFEADIDMETFIKANKLGNECRMLLNAYKSGIIDADNISLKQSGHYYHEYSMTVQYDYPDAGYYTDNKEDQEKILSQFELVMKYFEDNARDLAKEIYNSLEADYDSLMSDEAIEDFVISNEYEYTEDGSDRVYL